MSTHEFCVYRGSTWTRGRYLRVVLALLFLPVCCGQDERIHNRQTFTIPDIYINDIRRLDNLAPVTGAMGKEDLEEYMGFSENLMKLPPDYVLSFLLLSGLRRGDGAEESSGKRLELLAAIMRKDEFTGTHVLNWGAEQDLQSVMQKPISHAKGPVSAYLKMLRYYIAREAAEIRY